MRSPWAEVEAFARQMDAKFAEHWFK